MGNSCTLCVQPRSSSSCGLVPLPSPNPDNHHRFVNIKISTMMIHILCHLLCKTNEKGWFWKPAKSLHWLKSWFKHNRNCDFGVKINLKQNFKGEVVSFRWYVVGSQNTSASYLVMYFRQLQVCQWLTPSSFT